MICFDIYLNDRRLCLAGVGEFGHLSQYLVWDRRPAEDMPPYREGPDTDLALLVTGTRPGEVLTWAQTDIKVGDEIRVHVTEAATSDTPSRTTETERRQAAREVRRELYLKLKQEFESNEAAA